MPSRRQRPAVFALAIFAALTLSGCGGGDGGAGGSSSTPTVKTVCKEYARGFRDYKDSVLTKGEFRKEVKRLYGEASGGLRQALRFQITALTAAGSESRGDDKVFAPRGVGDACSGVGGCKTTAQTLPEHLQEAFAVPPLPEIVVTC